MELHSVIILFVVAFIIHDVEEILTVERFAHKNKQAIQQKLPPRMYAFLSKSLQMSTAQFAFAVMIVFIFVLISAYLGWRSLEQSSLSMVFLGAITIFVLHSFSHLGHTIYLKKVTPGAITSLFIVLPYGVYAYYMLVYNTQLVTGTMILKSIPYGLLIIPIVWLGHVLAQKLILHPRAPISG